MGLVESSLVLAGAVLGAAESSPSSAAFGVTVFVVMGAFGYLAWKTIKNRHRLDLVLEEQSRANAQMQANAERDQRAYAQHVALNDLTAEKIKLENQYLQLQVRIGQMEIESRERAEEYHRLMSEKTRFEIQSLKLHIREQNKRLDDYTGFNEDE